MAVSNRHILEQGAVLAGLGKTAVTAVAQQLAGKKAKQPVTTPTATITKTVPARSSTLVRDYVRDVGGDPAWYRGNVPAHFFPQWAFPIAGGTLEGIPYPMQKVMNGGCRIEVNGPIPEGKPLKTQAQLVEIDDNGRRAVLKQRIVTGTENDPAALCVYLFPIIPLGGKGKGDKGEKKEPLVVPDDARELCRWDLAADAGLDFAKLTGDFNPIHWVPPYAKAFGFGGVILHGFATMARAIEGLNRHLFNGDPTKLRVFDCQFTKPLRIPANVGLYVTNDKKVFVADRPGNGGSVYLRATYET